jgi:hypothetical protein
MKEMFHQALLRIDTAAQAESPALAGRLGSSQTRLAKMESADPSVSLDLMMRSLLTIGATATEVAK